MSSLLSLYNKYIVARGSIYNSFSVGLGADKVTLTASSEGLSLDKKLNVTDAKFGSIETTSLNATGSVILHDLQVNNNLNIPVGSSLSVLGSATLASLNVTGLSSLARFTSQGSSTITGDLTVHKTGSYTGNLVVEGDLNVMGTTTTHDQQSLTVKDNFIYTNADKVELMSLSGIGMNVNPSNTYAIAYDHTTLSVKLGLGTVDENGVFTFNTGEGSPITARDDSSLLNDGHLMRWDANHYRIVDSGISYDDVQLKITSSNMISSDFVDDTNSLHKFITSSERTSWNNKTDKVSGATSGNLAGLDSNGNLVDSGKKPSDFATSAQGSKADSAVQVVKRNGTVVTKTADGEVDITVPTQLSQLSEDENHKTVTQVQIDAWTKHEENVQADWTEVDPTADSYIKNKPQNLVQDADYVHTDNNFTDTLKGKLDGIENGAEVNVQADWNQSDSGEDDFIKNKPQNLVQDANYVHTDNNFTTQLKNKLTGIEEGAEVNVQPDWNETDDSKDDFINNKPTKTSDFTNDGDDGTHPFLDTSDVVDALNSSETTKPLSANMGKELNTNKISKVTDAVQGNTAVLNADGSISDSGLSFTVSDVQLDI